MSDMSFQQQSIVQVLYNQMMIDLYNNPDSLVFAVAQLFL